MRAPLGDVEVLHRDAHLLVLRKPAGLATTSPDAGDCLVARAARLDPDAPALHPLSRIDAMVTGLVAFARTKPMNQLALDARKRGAFERCYVALTVHAPAEAEGEWTWGIGLHARDKKLRRALEAGEGGPGSRDALTHYAVSGRGSCLTALRLWPRTGRTHQLRVHAAHAGAPLFGDVAYGGERRVFGDGGEVFASKRVQLHCAFVRLPVPGASAPVELRAAPFDDMRQLWESQGGQADALDGTRLPERATTSA